MLSIALDELKENDSVFEKAGFKFIMDSDLASNTGGLEIDYSTKWFSKGFTVSASNFGGAC